MTSQNRGKALVVGYGSIGARHARLLGALGFEVHVVSSRPGVFPRVHASLAAAMGAEHFSYVVVANETAKHRSTVEELLQKGFAGKILVEKPLWEASRTLLPENAAQLFVAYNLRFDPVLRALQAELAGKRFVSAEARACSYLPEWRAGRDYRATESARASAGGGVLRDMSHELDYVQWLLGPWTRVAALGGHLSPLEIDSDDVAMLLLETKLCPAVQVSLNYVDRQEERWIVVNTAGATYRADLMQGTLHRSGAEIFRAPPATADGPYIAQHLDVLDAGGARCCSLAEGLETVSLISAVEGAKHRKEWVTR